MSTSNRPINYPDLVLLDELPKLKRSDVQCCVTAILQAHADLLRQTADELDADSIHRCHAANRLRKIANEIAREK